MSLTNSRVCWEGRITIIATLTILLVWPTDAAIARSSLEIQQLYQHDSRLDSREKSSESVEWQTSGKPSLIIEDTQGTSVPEVQQQLIPDPLPPVFDEDLAMPAPRRLDVLQEAGAELPWPIGSYNAHVREIRIANNYDPLQDERRQYLLPEGSDKRHRYMHSILDGYGLERNVAGAFGA